MTTGTLLVFAAAVFALMLTGLMLSMREFTRISDEPSKKKGADV